MSAQGNGENPKSYRLTEHVRPTRYDVHLRADPLQPIFTGSVLIELTLSRPTDEIVLHARKLRIGSASVQAGGTTHTCAIGVDEARETATLTIPAQIESKKDELTDAEVIAILQRESKKRNDSVDQYEQGGRPELAEKEKRELIILQEFLPKPLSPDELEGLVRETIQELGATSKKEMGSVIKGVHAKAAGRADGKSISSLVGRLLP